MSRLNWVSPDRAQAVVEGLYKDVERRVAASPPGLCPVDTAAAFLKLCHAQTCGKCTPCRVGLGQLENLLEDILDGYACPNALELVKTTAETIRDSADCAIGAEAAGMVLRGLEGFAEDYRSHLENGICAESVREYREGIPCVGFCPARVDIPGYIALVGAGRYDDAVKLIRKDNPFPTVCALICEHPCENRCRRSMIDAPLNIRGLKKFAVEKAGKPAAPAKADATGKKVAVIGGGPGGLTAAYYLALMGHSVVVFEKRAQLGGMLRYGIPAYRLPRERLQEDIDLILSLGVEVKLNADIADAAAIKKLQAEYDAVYISVGAHTYATIGIDGEDTKGVIPAVDMLRAIGDGTMPSFSGKSVAVIGGGNVAMDVARTAKRLGAAEVNIVYRRRRADMTALAEEVEGAVAEGCEVMELMAPDHVEAKDGEVGALWVRPQIVGKISGGRPAPVDAKADKVRIPCDIIISAIGQKIEIEPYAELGISTKRGAVNADTACVVSALPGVFAGGDCVTGPATVIKAIAAGKTAAANIDEYLGFCHEISSDVEIPYAVCADKPAMGRVEIKERAAAERGADFEDTAIDWTLEEAVQEAGRCLRCDHFGLGSFKGGRVEKW